MFTIRDLRKGRAKRGPGVTGNKGKEVIPIIETFSEDKVGSNPGPAFCFFRKQDYFKMPCSFLQKSYHPSFLYILGNSFILESQITMLHSLIDVQSLVILPVTLFDF